MCPGRDTASVLVQNCPADTVLNSSPEASSGVEYHGPRVPGNFQDASAQLINSRSGT